LSFLFLKYGVWNEVAMTLYTAEARVTGGRAEGHGRTPGGELDVRIRTPRELGGDGGGTNPEQLFAVGYAACFEAALSLAAPGRDLPTVIDARVSLVPADGGALALAVALDVTLPVDDAADLVRAAHRVCPYSNAVRGNVEVVFTVNGAPLAP
jgi:osmotically inducible protein OsmC